MFYLQSEVPQGFNEYQRQKGARDATRLEPLCMFFLLSYPFFYTKCFIYSQKYHREITSINDRKGLETRRVSSPLVCFFLFFYPFYTKCFIYSQKYHRRR